MPKKATLELYQKLVREFLDSRADKTAQKSKGGSKMSCGSGLCELWVALHEEIDEDGNTVGCTFLGAFEKEKDANKCAKEAKKAAGFRGKEAKKHSFLVEKFVPE